MAVFIVFVGVEEIVCGQACRVVGPAARAWSSGNHGCQGRGLTSVICSTLQDAGFKPGTVPAAGLFDVLEHIEDDVGFLKTLNEILVPKGRVFLTVIATDTKSLPPPRSRTVPPGGNWRMASTMQSFRWLNQNEESSTWKQIWIPSSG